MKVFFETIADHPFVSLFLAGVLCTIIDIISNTIIIISNKVK